MILVIDNYDSFTFNLVALLRQEARVEVAKNDEISLETIISNPPAGIVISPGPGRPADSGISVTIVDQLTGKIPILGVCLGHQLIAEQMGAKVVHAARPMHGKTTLVLHKQNSLFANLPSPLQVMRYHSLVVCPASLPEELEVTAWTEQGEVMGIQHKIYNLAGIQFHPESILTPQGPDMIQNWIVEIRARQHQGL